MVLDRNQAARWVFGSALAIFAYRYFTHSLVHQLQQPLLSKSDFDYAYWFYHFIHFPEVFVKNRMGAIFFDGALLVSTIACFINMGRNREVVLLCALSWSFYGLTYNSYSYYHSHALIGIMVLPYAFLAKEEDNFKLAWDGFRYFCLYIYADAFFLKVLAGPPVFSFPAGLEIILQGCMLVGFFTRRWDRVLFFLPILLLSMTYFFDDAFYFELLILNLTLLPFKEKNPF